MNKKFVFATGILLLAFIFPKKGFSQYAELSYLQHVCQGQLGAATFELTGDPSQYTYHWLPNGEETLGLVDLEPGSYTFVVQNAYGCVEEYRVDILELSSCQIYSSVEPLDGDFCFNVISISVVDGATGIPLDENSLNIQWSDGVVGGLVRIVPVNGDFTSFLSVMISSNGGGNCCTVSDQFLIPGNPNCKKKKLLVVNELNKPPNGVGQFVELLVVGDGECNTTMDVRGFFVDDNNGLLIPGNELITANNNQVIGVNHGALLFSQHRQWEDVSTGSLIVIYDEQNHPPKNMPALDPSDANQDGVYILNASDENYLLGKTGNWNSLTTSEDYTGVFEMPSWEKVRITDNADGMQTRNPDGTYCHGISSGVSTFSANNNFPLWIGNTSTTNCNCQLVGIDYLLKEEFSCLSIDNISSSPGLPNTPENETLILQLTDCFGNIRDNAIGGNRLLLKEVMTTYPNPFEEVFTIEFISAFSGEGKIKIKDISGKELIQHKIKCEKGKNENTVTLDKNIAPGVFILSLELPSGQEKHARIIKANL